MSRWGIEESLTPETADVVYNEVAARLADPSFRPRALYDRFGIAFLATTDPATSALRDHAAIRASDWSGHIVPTFRPDDLLNPARPGHVAALAQLAEMTGRDIGNYEEFLDALRDRRVAFRAAGATATDHDVPQLATTCWLGRDRNVALHTEAVGRYAVQ